MERLNNLDEIVQKYCVSNSPFRRRMYIVIGTIFVVFSVIGIWIPGWPTVSWAIPAAFLFSQSSERMFRWTLTNRYFGNPMFEYYASGKTIPRHAKSGIIAMISIMALLSAMFVWYVSTLGEGSWFDPSTWDGADPGFGAVTIIIVGLLGVWYVGARVRTRDP